MSVWEPEERAAGGVSVLVAAGSVVTRAGLEAILARDPALAVVGGDPGASVAEEAERYEPDVVLMDLTSVPDEEDALTDLHLAFVENGGASAGRPGIVVLSDRPRSAWLGAALRRGVRALLPRTAGAEEILAAVRSVAAGLIVLPAVWLESLLDLERGDGRPAVGVAAPEAGDRPPGAEATHAGELTSREREVLGMIAEGLANKQIAARLGISGHTVKFHVASVLAKLHASTRAEAVMLGARRGLIVL